MRTLRLRQAVVAARDRDAIAAEWRDRLRLGEPYQDPGVEVFGLCNAVVPVGDAFLEVVAPSRPGDGCAAERFMHRHGGDCGYMAIFQVDDITSARDHLAELGIRSVWQADLDDISCTHVHPADLRGAIVSFDQATPESSWRWAGPTWPEQVRTEVVSGLAGVTFADADPDVLMERWSNALDVEPDGRVLRLEDGSSVTFRLDDGGRTGLVGIDLWAADAAVEQQFDIAGVTFSVIHRPG